MACLGDHDDSISFDTFALLKKTNFSIIQKEKLTGSSTPVKEIQRIDTSACSESDSHDHDTLPTNDNQVRDLISSEENIFVRVVTWNQEARPHPTSEEVRKYLIPLNHYHIIAVGTQECENSIAVSLVNPSKAKWEENVTLAVGNDYCKVCDRVLQATYL
jgi:hypothetical protein